MTQTLTCCRKDPPVPDDLKSVAVRLVKPRVSAGTWRRLRAITGAKAAPPPPPPRPPSLTDLAVRYGTDKWGRHRYTPHYERHLRHLRNRSFTLLEIGIGGYSRAGQGGASLRMWKDYFRKAQIIGLDIEDKSFVIQKRIQAYRGSQIDETLLRTIVDSSTNLKVVIDDGSHRPEHIRRTFELVFPLLPTGAVYAIEDTQTSYWPRFGGSTDPADPTTTMALVKSLVDGLNWEEYHDAGYVPTYTERHVVAVHCYHNLVFIMKGDNNEGTSGGHS